ncbi:Protein of unknown function [Pyronema omphalodes CBS 100304]|uniref:Uncharacterized protein n=1 Tax=Pyronema omphalodes (strain CBS 100304) TaxID=1076935 RepID=U4L802_PYROM|nr:Protein of unknown function [Pyronema omphalodes CBS 100304]
MVAVTGMSIPLLFLACWISVAAVASVASSSVLVGN